jgi:hypothetical protein
LQRISPDVMIIQSVEKYPTLVQLTHSLSLVFRVQTETGYMIVVRNIDSPQLLSLMKAGGLSLRGNFFWDTFDVAHRNARGECDAVRYTLAGSVGSDDPTYVRRMRDEILIALVRAENQLRDASICVHRIVHRRRERRHQRHPSCNRWIFLKVGCSRFKRLIAPTLSGSTGIVASGRSTFRAYQK